MSSSSGRQGPENDRHSAYRVLGVSTTASRDEIKSAFKRLAKIYHPDRAGTAETVHKFREITEAADLLLKGPQHRWAAHAAAARTWTPPPAATRGDYGMMNGVRGGHGLVLTLCGLSLVAGCLLFLNRANVRHDLYNSRHQQIVEALERERQHPGEAEPGSQKQFILDMLRERQHQRSDGVAAAHR